MAKANHPTNTAILEAIHALHTYVVSIDVRLTRLEKEFAKHVASSAAQHFEIMRTIADYFDDSQGKTKAQLANHESRLVRIEHKVF